MNRTAPTGPTPTALPVQDDPIVRDLFPRLQRMADTDGSDHLAAFTRTVLVAAERYLIAVQGEPATVAELLPPSSPTVRANEHILQGALRALAVDDLPHGERNRIIDLARQAGRAAGLDHLVVAGRTTEVA